MRCHFRRLIYLLIIIISLAILYQIKSISKNNKFSQSQSSFRIIHYKNQTYRILSSTFHYNSRGSYLNFAYFNVEQRQRVLYIDYLYDIPISSQWQSNGYFYPIQIAQFGLSHWSRLNLNQLNDIYKFERLQPKNHNSCSSWYQIKNQIFLSNSFIHFTISSNISLHIQLINNNIDLIYSTIRDKNFKIFNQIIIPLEGSPRQVNRYILIDIEKSLKKSLEFKNDFIKFRVCGKSDSFIDQLIIGNQTLYNQQAFYSAIKWLLDNQDLKTGCWFIYIQKKFTKHHLRMPWCSAMAQGQAASLLVRLYSQTNNPKYLSSIHQAIQPLYLSNLTQAYFNNKYLWLEEYPLESSTKSLFVLNGCLYTLIGLIDVYTIDPQSYLNELINQIINSLYHMLPYYVHPKITNWSLYDLSHITMKTEVNTASYSYHLVHITLLQCLSEIYRKRNSSVSKFFDFYVQKFVSVIL